MAANNQLNAILVFGGDATQAINAVNKLNTSLTALTKKVGNISTQSKKTTSNMGATWGKLGDIWRGLWQSGQRIFDSFRLMAQGIMSAGRALTFFVAIPLTLMLKQGLTVAIEFEDQMKRVQKTTGMTSAQISALTENIRGIARSAPSSHEQLAMMAEQAGQLGIQSVKGITTFVKWMEILATSTDISADDVVKTMGKIAAAFGWNIDESADNAIRLANVMNMLENTTAATAGEIADALFRFAPVAKQLNITAAEAAALSAALISVGVSSEATGTRLGTMFVKLTQNADKFAELAANTAKYATEQDVLNAIDEDAVEVLYDLIVMMDAENSRAKALAESFDLVGLRGGRALGALTSGQSELTKALRIAKIEWTEATSLIAEYNRQMESTKSQLQVLKNNINDAAIELGQALLPAINDAIEILIPLVRRLISWLDKLDDATKVFYVFAVAVGAVAGPIIFFVSQLAFGFFMVGLGVFKLIGAISGAILTIGKIIGLLVSMGNVGVAVGIALVGGVALIMRVIQKAGIDIASKFRDLGNAAKTWGENLAANIANGLVAGAVKYIAAAVTYIANLIASFLEAHSPPDVGPLSHINRWGKALIDTYLKSMKEADFSILKEVSGIIEKVFATLAKSGLMGDKDQFKFLLKARQDLAKLLSEWRRTGKISEKVLNDVVAHLGNAADEVKKLIRLQFALLAIEEKLAALERRRKDVQQTYTAEIGDIVKSGKTAAERVELIRKAMRARNDELRTIEREKAGLEDQKTIAEEQLDTQKALIEAMQEQDDIQSRLIDALEKMAGAASAMAEGFPEIEPGGLDLPDEEDIKNALGEPFLEIEVRIRSKESIVDAFLGALKGEDVFEGVDWGAIWGSIPESAGGLKEQIASRFGVQPEDFELLVKANEKGLELHNTWERITTKADEFRTILGNITSGEIFKDLIPKDTQDKFSDFGKNAGQSFEKIKKFIDDFKRGFSTAFKPIAAILDKSLMPAFKRLGEQFDKFKEALGVQPDFNLWEWLSENAENIGATIGALVGTIALVVGFIVSFFSNLISTWLEYWSIIVDGTSSIPEKIMAVFGILLAPIIALFLSLKDVLLGIWALVGDYIEGGIESARKRLTDWVESTKAKFVEWKNNVIATIAQFVLDVIGGFEDLKVKTYVKIVLWVLDMLKKFEDFKTETIKVVAQWVLDLLADFEAFALDIGTWADGLVQSFIEWAEGWMQALADGILNGKQWVLDEFDAFIQGAIDLFEPLLNVITRIMNFVKNPPAMPSFPGVHNDDEEEGTGNSYSGHIVTSRANRIVGEVPEAIIPLSKLPSILQRLQGLTDYGGSGTGGAPITMNFNFGYGSVRSDQDIRDLAEAVKQEFDKSIGLSVAYSIG